MLAKVKALVSRLFVRSTPATSAPPPQPVRLLQRGQVIHHHD